MAEHAELCVVLRDETGAVVPNTAVSVWSDSAATTLATLYTTRTGTLTYANPLTSDADGILHCFHENQRLWYTTAVQTVALPLVTQTTPFTVKDYGAVGDGVTDDAVALQYALDNAGQELHVPAGTYLVGSQLFVRTAGLHLFGEGIDKSVFKQGDGTDAGVFHISEACTIENLTIDGNSAQQTGGSIVLLDSAGVCFERVHFYDSVGYSIHQYGSGLHAACDNLVLRDCIIEKVVSANTYNADVLLSGGGENVFVTGCHFKGGAHLCPFGDDSFPFPGMRVTNNLVTDSDGCGLEIWCAPGLVCSDNVVKDCDLYGISIGWSEGATISNNTIDGATDIGIELANNHGDPDRQTSTQNHTVVVGNTIRNTGGTGWNFSVFPYQDEGISIIGNTIDGGVHGILFGGNGGARNITVAHNSLSGFTDIGITVQSTNPNYDFNITGNTIYCDGWSGAGQHHAISEVVAGTGWKISDNLIVIPSSGTVDVGSGIVIRGTGHLVSGNLITGNTKLAYGIQAVTTSASCVFSGNFSNGTSIIGLQDASTTSPYNTWTDNRAIASANLPFQIPNSRYDGITGGRIHGSMSAAPTTGTWVQGDIIFNNFGATDTKLGWICREAGTPGTWRSFGSIDPP